jgi:hypothetical protein
VRAYMICLLCVGQRLDGAAVHFIVLPQARRSNGRASAGRQFWLRPTSTLWPPGSCNACDDASYVAVKFRWNGDHVDIVGTPPDISCASPRESSPASPKGIG